MKKFNLSKFTDLQHENLIKGELVTGYFKDFVTGIETLFCGKRLGSCLKFYKYYFNKKTVMKFAVTHND